jgi:hypothetical protein
MFVPSALSTSTRLDVKMRMCSYFNVWPKFIARVMRKNYISRVQRAGGFSLILGSQFYPLLAEDFAREIRDVLKLPVTCVRQWPNATMRREWHEKSLA